MDQEILGSELSRGSIRCRQPSTRRTDRHPGDHCSARTWPTWGGWSQSKYRNEGGREDTNFWAQIIVDTTERGNPGLAGTIEGDVNAHGGVGKGARLLLCQGTIHPIALMGDDTLIVIQLRDIEILVQQEIESPEKDEAREAGVLKEIQKILYSTEVRSIYQADYFFDH